MTNDPNTPSLAEYHISEYGLSNRTFNAICDNTNDSPTLQDFSNLICGVWENHEKVKQKLPQIDIPARRGKKKTSSSNQKNLTWNNRFDLFVRRNSGINKAFKNQVTIMLDDLGIDKDKFVCGEVVSIAERTIEGLYNGEPATFRPYVQDLSSMNNEVRTWLERMKAAAESAANDKTPEK